MTYPLLSRCPICDGDLLATRLECTNCHGAVEGEFELGPLARLNREQANLLALLVKYRGNMNRAATELGVHYNTVRNRMDELAAAFGFGELGAGGSTRAGAARAARPAGTARARLAQPRGRPGTPEGRPRRGRSFMSNAFGPSQSLQLRIIDINTGQLKVALTLPIGLIGTAQRLGAMLLPPDTSIDTIVGQAESDGVAQVVWIDDEHAERLELTVE